VRRSEVRARRGQRPGLGVAESLRWLVRSRAQLRLLKLWGRARSTIILLARYQLCWAESDGRGDQYGVTEDGGNQHGPKTSGPDGGR
jgi:hypothetical protein